MLSVKVGQPRFSRLDRGASSSLTRPHFFAEGFGTPKVKIQWISVSEASSGPSNQARTLPAKDQRSRDGGLRRKSRRGTLPPLSSSNFKRKSPPSTNKTLLLSEKHGTIDPLEIFSTSVGHAFAHPLRQSSVTDDWFKAFEFSASFLLLSNNLIKAFVHPLPFLPPKNLPHTDLLLCFSLFSQGLKSSISHFFSRRDRVPVLQSILVSFLSLYSTFAVRLILASCLHPLFP